MNKQPMASGSSSDSTHDDPLLSHVRSRIVRISKEDSVTDSQSKPKTRENSGDKAVNGKQVSSVQQANGEDPEDPAYHESIPEGYVPDHNLPFPSETQSTLEPPQDAGPGTSATLEDGNTRPLGENGRDENKIQHKLMDLHNKLMKTGKTELVELHKKEMDSMKTELVELHKKEMDSMKTALVELHKKEMDSMKTELVELHKEMDSMKTEQVELHKKQMEMMKINLRTQLMETIHNSSPAMPTEDPWYPASNPHGGRGGINRVRHIDNGTSTSAALVDGNTRRLEENGSSVMPLTERGEEGCLANGDDKPSFQLSLPSCQKAEAGTSITSATYGGTTNATVDKRTSIQSQAGSSKSRPMANDKNASVEELKDPGDASHVSGASGAAKVFKWMFLMWTFYLQLSMKCKQLFTRIKVYKVMSLLSDGISYLCSWTHFHISKGVASLVPICILLVLLYVLPNSVENDYFQIFIKEFTNIRHAIFLFKCFLGIILYIEDQRYVVDATANPLLYPVLVCLFCLFSLLILTKNNHVTTFCTFLLIFVAHVSDLGS